MYGMIIAQIYKDYFMEMDFWTEAMQDIKKNTNTDKLNFLMSHIVAFNLQLDIYFFRDRIVKIDESTRETWDKYSDELDYWLIGNITDPDSKLRQGFEINDIIDSYNKLKRMAIKCGNPDKNIYDLFAEYETISNHYNKYIRLNSFIYNGRCFDSTINEMAVDYTYCNIIKYNQDKNIDYKTESMLPHGEKCFYDSMGKCAYYYALIINLLCQRKKNILYWILCQDPMGGCYSHPVSKLRNQISIYELRTLLGLAPPDVSIKDINIDDTQDLIVAKFNSIHKSLCHEGRYIVDPTINRKELHWCDWVDVYYEYPSINEEYKLCTSKAKFKLPALYVKYAFPSQSNFELTITENNAIKKKPLSYFDMRDKLPSIEGIKQIINACNKSNHDKTNIEDLVLTIQEKYFDNLFRLSRNLPGADGSSQTSRRGIADNFKKTFDTFCSNLIEERFLIGPTTESCWEDADWLKKNAFLFQVFYIFRAYSLWVAAPSKAPFASSFDEFELKDSVSGKTLKEIGKSFPIISYTSFGETVKSNESSYDDTNKSKIKNHDKIGSNLKRAHLDTIPFDPIFALLLFNLDLPKSELKYFVELNGHRFQFNNELQAAVGNISADEYLKIGFCPDESFRLHFFMLAYDETEDNRIRCRFGLFSDTTNVMYTLYRRNIEMHNKLLISIGKIILDGVVERLSAEFNEGSLSIETITILHHYIAEHILKQINNHQPHVIKYLQSKCRKVNIDNKDFNNIIKKDTQVKRTNSETVAHLDEFIFRGAVQQEIGADIIRSAINLMPEICGNVSPENKEKVWLHNFIISLMIQIRFLSKIDDKIPGLSTTKIKNAAVNKIVIHPRVCVDEPSKFKYTYISNGTKDGCILYNRYLTMPNIFDVSEQALAHITDEQLYIHLQDIIYYFVHIIFGHFYEIHQYATYHTYKDGSQHEYMIQLNWSEINNILNIWDNNNGINSPIQLWGNQYYLDYFK